MAEPWEVWVSRQLLEDIRNYLDITWDDPATDRKVAGMAASGVRYLDEKAGQSLDYALPGDGRTLLFEYVRYARDGALDVFENNYRSLILAMQNKRRVEAFETDAVSP